MTHHFKSHRRLSRGDSVSRIAEMTNLTVEQCESLVDPRYPKSYPPAVGRPTMSTAEANALRDDVLEIAKPFGFPRRKGAKDTALSEFDASLGNLLLERLEITPAEAGQEEVWSFLTLALLPDIAKWRFPNSSENPEFDRWLGKPRNVLRKAWWRAYALGPKLNLQIGEDEGVNIMERPTFGMNPVLAQAIAEVHVNRAAESPLSRSDTLRKVMVQMRKLASFMEIDCLSNEETLNLVDEIYSFTLEALRDIE